MATTTERGRVSTTGLWLAAARPLRGLRLAWSGAGVLTPVLIVVGALVVLIVQALGLSGGSLLGLVQFGRHFLPYTHPPHGAPVLSPDGYDGQFYWIQATDPLLLHSSTLAALAGTHPDFMQRLAYPALAFVLAGGQRAALPESLLAVNVIAVLGVTWAFARYAREQGWSPMWALVVGLTPGLLMPVLRDLTDPLATSAMLGGLLAWERDRRWWAAALLATAALAREPMIAAVLAIAADATARWWRVRAGPGALRRAARRAWPVLVVPVALFGAWQAYIHIRYVPTTAVAAPAQLAPAPTLQLFAAFNAELHRTVRQDPPGIAAWDATYMLLMLLATAASVALLRKGVRAATVAAILMAAIVSLIGLFGDEWGVSRYGAPVFVTLLLAGLQVRSRSAVAIATAAAVLSLFVPLVVAAM